jgi:enterochelin esterase family protein
MSSNIVIDTFESKTLADNPLKDPVIRKTVVYLPPNYHRHKKYPVVYLLTGFTGFGLMMLNYGAYSENIQQRMDRLIQSGEVKDMIIVMPDCFTRYGGSQYMNSPAFGNYEDFLIKELIPHIENNFGVYSQDNSHRAIMGKSSGGYGAIRLAMKYPELFSTVACHSGDMYFEYCYKLDIPKFLKNIGKYGGLEKFINDIEKIVPKNNDFISVLNIIGMSCSYSPNINNPPFYFDLPCDIETGEIKEEIWQKWLENDPVYMIDIYKENLRKCKLIYLDCGNKDEFFLHYGARIFTKKLKKYGIQCFYEEFDDGHFNIQYRYDISLKKISEAISDV